MSILVIGGGKMGLSHLAILSRIVPKEDVCLCEGSLVKRLLFGRLGYRTFKSLDAALESQIHWTGAIVATPTSSHFPITKTLLLRKIPCFVEKPLTLDPVKSQELVDLQRQAGVHAQVGLAARFIAAFIKIKWIVDSNALGRPIHYRARLLGNVITQPDNTTWRTDFAQGGGCLNEYGPHLIDLCRYAFGNVESIQQATARKVYSVKADDAIDIAWTHASGCQGEVCLDWCDASKRKAAIDFVVTFERGRVESTNSELTVYATDGEVIPGPVKAQLYAPLQPPSVIYYLRGEEFSLQLEIFVKATRSDPALEVKHLPSEAAATLADGLEVDRLIREIAGKAGLA
jgi:predicted dehydrogenase